VKYIEWDIDSIQNMSSISGMIKLYTEIEDDGSVCREIGINQEGIVIHKFPSDHFKQGKYGLFDNQIVEVKETVSLDKNNFELLWNH